jgi:hypothetical protein
MSMLLSRLPLWQYYKEWFSNADKEDDHVSLDIAQLEHDHVRESK